MDHLSYISGKSGLCLCCSSLFIPLKAAYHTIVLSTFYDDAFFFTNEIGQFSLLNKTTMNNISNERFVLYFIDRGFLI